MTYKKWTRCHLHECLKSRIAQFDNVNTHSFSRFANPHTDTTPYQTATEFGFKPSSGKASVSAIDPSSPKRAPHSSTTRKETFVNEKDNFEIKENTRVALEEKSKLVEKLQKQLSLTEASLRTRATRTHELERRLREHEGNKVLDEADALHSSLSAAMRDVTSFFSSGGKVKDAAPTGTAPNGTTTPHGVTPNSDMPSGTPPSALKSGLKSSSFPQGNKPHQLSHKKSISFVSADEQHRLDEEGTVVMKLQMQLRKNEELQMKLKTVEDALARKRQEMRVAKKNYVALQKRLEEEISLRERIERNGSRNASSTRGNTPETSTATNRVLQGVLRITAHVAGVSGRGDTNGVLRALPALAQISKNETGGVSLDLIDAGVVELVTETFEVHQDDQQICARVCALLAQLCCGANAATARHLRARKNQCADAVASDLKIAQCATVTLQNHRSNPEACACAIDLLYELSRLAGRNAPGLIQHWVKNRILESVTEIVAWHVSDADVLASASKLTSVIIEFGGQRVLERVASVPRAISTVSRAVSLGVIGALEPNVARWVNDNDTGDMGDTTTREKSHEIIPEVFSEFAGVTPRRRAAIPEDDEYVGSGFKPSRRAISQRKIPQFETSIESREESDDDFDDNVFDDKL